ncbi:MAG: helicase-related protein, partial [Acidimicrobiales bacterium]
GRVIDEVATISLVEHALAAPAPLSTAAAALGQLPERAGVAGDELKREAAALILLGAAAHQGAVGEEEGEPRLRPRLHQVVRSLAGLWRCLDPGCGLLAKPGAAQCQGSGAMTLPIASCRTCGEAYWASPRGGRALPEVDRLLSIDLRRDEPRLLLDASVAERDYYHRQYLSSPRRLIVREHSGQVEGDERLALEERFNDRAHPSVDVLACTPTLEVGVSLDDLHAVVLRNLPPTPANYAQRVGRAGRRSRVALAVAHAGQAPHDSYFFDSPGELIAGEVRAPAISLDNEPLLRRHVNSLILETLGLDLPARWVPPLDADQEWGGETVADRDGVLRESALAPFAQLLDRPEVRSELKAGVRGAFASAYDPAPPAHSELICAQQLSQFLPDLRAALNRWCDRYRALLDEFAALRRGLGVPSKADQDLEGRLRRELEGLAGQKTPEHQPLGFLGLVGFLPRYGFTGSSVLLHPPLADALLVQRAWVAVTEFAPDNIVYARGHKIKVRRLHPAPVPESSAEPDHRDNVLREARRCDDCEVLVFDPLVKACPGCGQDLVGQRVVELTGVRGAGAAISSEDEYRTRADYDVVHCLGETSQAPEVKTVGGLTFERTSGREIVLANRGLAPAGGGRAPGFSICTGCGYAAETRPTSTTDGGDGDPDEAAERGHSPRCPGRKDPSGEVVRSGVWLTATIRGDAMELKLPAATRGPELTAWRTTLAEALLLGIRETMQAGARDLGWFIRPLGAEPQAIVCYDTMPGGTGYLPKLFTDGGAGLRAAADEALARLG